MIELNHCFQEFIDPDSDTLALNKAYRYFFAHGGRGGGKSHFVAELLVLLGYFTKQKILCAREFQTSIEDSVLSLLKEKIEYYEELGVIPRGFYVEKKNKLYGANGTYFSFIGLARNIGSIKSLNGYTICWVEEGQYISYAAWVLLKPTIRDVAGSYQDAQFIITMNRESATACLDKEFIQADNPPPRSLVRKVNYTDNPYDIPILEEDAEHCKKVDFEAFRYIWLGELNMVSNAQVLHGKWRTENFDTAELTRGKQVAFYHGADWSNGGADPHTLIRSFIIDNKLYIDYELFTNQDFQELPELWERCPSLEANIGNRMRLWKVYADGARPDLIRMMYNKGFNVTAAPKKWKGDKSSIEAGIDYLRGFDEIVIHETKCPKMAEEAANWKRKIDDASGEVTPILIDAHNHGMDATRYSHYPVISNVRKRERR